MEPPSSKPIENSTNSSTLQEQGKSDQNATQALDTDSNKNAQSYSNIILQIIERLEVLESKFNVIQTRLENTEETNNKLKVIVTKIAGILITTNSTEVVSNVQDGEFQRKLNLNDSGILESIENIESAVGAEKQGGTPNPRDGIKNEEYLLTEPSVEIVTPGMMNSESFVSIEPDSISDDQQGLAPRDFQAGEYVFTRKRLLSFPKPPNDKDLETWWYNDPFQNPRLNHHFDTCNSCFEVMKCETRGGKNLCAKCGWPVHSHDPVTKLPTTSCQQKHEQECAKFRESGFFYKIFLTKVKTNIALGVWRAISLPDHSKEKLLKLSDSMPDHSPNFDKCKHLIDGSLLFVRKMEIFKSISDEDLKKIVRIICLNSLYPPATYPCFSHKRKLLISIYDGPSTGRILPHDCNPNCEIYLNPETFDAVVKTTRIVHKGEKLTISYIENIFPKPVHERDEYLDKLFMPPCTCSTCKDPTEGGTYASAIKIPINNHKTGKTPNHPCEYAVPYRISKSKSTTGNSDARFEWNCECKRCLETPITQEFVKKMIEDFDNASSRVDERGLKLLFDPNDGLGWKFHPNHASLVPVRVDIALLALKQIEKFMHLRPHFDYSFHSKYLEDIETAVSLLATYGRTRHEDYRILLLYQAFMRLSKLAERTGSESAKPNVQELSMLLESIMNDLEKCSTLKKENPFAEKLRSFSSFSEEDRISYFTFQLIDVVFKEAKNFCYDPSFRIFFKKYYKKPEKNLEETVV